MGSCGDSQYSVFVRERSEYQPRSIEIIPRVLRVGGQSGSSSGRGDRPFMSQFGWAL